MYYKKMNIAKECFFCMIRVKSSFGTTVIEIPKVIDIDSIMKSWKA